ncbi:MAG: RtcB family protein [Candidatus Brennerbacteria bacterium]|nr:RtcB family protein [Candidatus Brennerbacteria bacterium]
MLRKSDLEKVSDYVWEIPWGFRSDMLVPGRIFASEKILEDILNDESLEQVVNVATLPGIQGYSLAMPDIHEGYGFPVGGVAAFDVSEGVISPGGIGFDINCGVRVLKSGADFHEVKDKIPPLTEELYKQVPSGVGRGGEVQLTTDELNKVLKDGVQALFEKGFATEEDMKNCESGGKLPDADPDKVSKTAKKRGHDQMGTMGAGNHFVEVQRVDKIFDAEVAKELGIFEGEAAIMIHCGSRGLGHQVATDYIQEMLHSLQKYKITLPDKQLACAPFNSPEGQNYWKAMSAAANFAWANRQMITYLVRRAWQKILGSGTSLGLIYDVSHNIAKIEECGGRKVVVHRKGATRAFPNQPVLIPGSMGTASYILVGQEGSLKQSFGSSCHGAGRVMSRTKAKRSVRGSELKKELEEKGISVAAGSMAGLAEEAPLAYKDVEEVVRVVDEVGLAKRVARMRPVGVVKG